MNLGKCQAVKYDELYTPKEAILPILRYLDKNKIYWECCGNKSKITEILKENGFNIIETSFDFLNKKPDFYFDIIITNPPYSLKDDFIKKCYEYNKPFLLLLPITALEGIRRGKMFKEKGISLIVLNKRIDFTGKKSNWFNTSWFNYKITNGLIFEEVIINE